MTNGYITESEAQFIRDKTKMSDKFQEVFDFYHETVPKEDVLAKAEPIPAQDDVNNGTQTLDSEPKAEQIEQTES